MQMRLAIDYLTIGWTWTISCY